MATQLLRAAPDHARSAFSDALSTLKAVQEDIVNIIGDEAKQVELELDSYEGEPALSVTIQMSAWSLHARAHWALENHAGNGYRFINVTTRRAGSSATKFHVTALMVPA